MWQEQKNQNNYTAGTLLNPENRLYTNYTQSYRIDENSTIALKTGLRDIPHIVRIYDDGTEEKLFAPGFFFPNAFHYAAGKLVWNEQSPDPRWEHRNWSEIMIYDLQTGERKRITNKGRFFAPALSPDGEKIATVETTPLSKYSLVVLDAETAEVISRFSYSNNDFIMEPAWHPDGNSIAVIALNSLGKRIDIIDTETQTPRSVLPASHTEISSPQFAGENIIFTGAWSGINNIYRVEPRSGQVEKIISSIFGADFAAVSETDIIWSDYTADGYRLMKTNISNLIPIPLDKVEDHSPKFHQTLAQQEETIVTVGNIPRREHEVTRYSRLRNLFHLHSWAPAYIDGASQEASIGASMLFQNKLSTSFATLGYLWDVNDKTGKFKAAYTYRGWYPVIDFSGETGERRFYYPTDQGTRNFILNENTYRVNVSIPLQFRRHEYFYGISPSISFEVNHATPEKSVPDTIFVQHNRFFLAREEQVYRQLYRIFAYNQVRSVARDVFPKWGQILDISYRHTPFSPKDLPSIFAIRGVGFFPGLVRHHGVRLSASYQKRSPLEPGTDRSFFYGFGNAIPYPRGYTGQFHQTVRAFAADYALPLWYPDLSIPYLIYLMRLRGHVFADYANAIPFPVSQNQSSPQAQILTSYGFGLTGDMHLFRFIAPISLGVEVAFPDGEDVGFQMIMGVRF